MPEKATLQRVAQDKRAGKSASTQAGEFVKEQVDRIRAGRHGARSPAQAIAIGLSEARRAGVDLPPPGKKASKKTRDKAETDKEPAKAPAHKPSAKRSRATTEALRREPTSSASTASLSRHAKSAAAKRTAGERSASAHRAAETKAKR